MENKKEMSFKEMLKEMKNLQKMNIREYVKAIIAIETCIEDEDKLDEIYWNWMEDDSPLIIEEFYEYE